MKTIQTTIFLIVLILFGLSCGNGNNTEEPTDGINQDSVALTGLVRNVYAWRETVNQEEDFSVMGGDFDTVYTGVDWKVFDLHLQALQESNLFHPEFIDNHKKIATQIDQDLKSGKIVWLIDDMSPYGNGANPWCNCQDYPDNYWDKITLTDLKINHEKASFAWTWGGDFHYKARAQKDNGLWKISYLEGFDFNEFMGL